MRARRSSNWTGYAVVLASRELSRVQAVSTIASVVAFATMEGFLPFEKEIGPLVTAVTKAAETVTGDRLFRRSATGGGDAKKLRNAGISTVGLGLGTDTVHAVDEYTTVDALRSNALVYAMLPYWLDDDESRK